jgi:hypothetical protein
MGYTFWGLACGRERATPYLRAAQAAPEDSLPRPLQFQDVKSRRAGIESEIRDLYSIFKERFSTQFMRAVFSEGRSMFAFGREPVFAQSGNKLGSLVVKSSLMEPWFRVCY